MNIPILTYTVIIFLVLSVFATDNNVAPRKLDSLCGSYEMREMIHELQRKTDEGRFKDVLLESKDIHIKDLQIRNVELQRTYHVFEKIVESVNSEIVQLKIFIKEELARGFTKIDSQASRLRYYEEQLRKTNRAFAASAAQIKYRDDILKRCQLRLNEAQSVVRECKDRVEIIIVENTTKISKKEEEILKLKEKIKKYEDKPNSCIPFGDSNGIHNIKVTNFGNFSVLCNSEIAGPGWTVIQQRINGVENFNRDWETYKNGFGSFVGDFFLGLEKIHRLTSDQPHELYIHMEWHNGSTFFARYDNFTIGGEADYYRLLSLGSFSGNAHTDKMKYHEHIKFSTYDRDNDEWEGVNCAKDYNGGWWYDACGYCNLNGKYYRHQVDEYNSNWWVNYFSLKTIKMLIHPRAN